MTTPAVVGATVLLVADDPDVHALVTAMLRPLGVASAVATDGAGALQLVREQAVDLILLDHDLPGRSGLDVLAELRADARLARIPVIMVTGSDSHAVLAECFAAGAQDYLRTPFFAAELRARVGGLLERQQLLAELVGPARRDSLTGLPERAVLLDQLRAAVRAAKASTDAGFALLFLDVDRFTVVNDRLGHEVGDQLLRAIAARLNDNLRTSDTMIVGDSGETVPRLVRDTVARLGGDEFVAVLPGVCDLVAAAAVADRLLEVLGLPYQLGQRAERVSASIGIACNTGQYDSPDALLRDAGIAMNAAKARGKGGWVAFSDAMRTEVAHRQRLETELWRAIEEETLSLVYQPIVSLADRSVTGVEALVRWRHPALGDVPPAEFIAVAEEARLSRPLSQWILDRACRDLARWRLALGARAPRHVSVKLPHASLGDPGLVDRVLVAVRDAGLAPEDLQLEVTASQLVAYRTAALAECAALHAAGVRLVMHDAGAGHASLACLPELPLHVLKIDRQLVATLRLGRDFATLVRAVITLADSLGLEVVAEGIEDRAQLAVLQDLGCRGGQGGVFAAPMPSPELVAWLAAGAHDGAIAPLPAIIPELLEVPLPTLVPDLLDVPHDRVA